MNDCRPQGYRTPLIDSLPNFQSFMKNKRKFLDKKLRDLKFKVYDAPDNTFYTNSKLDLSFFYLYNLKKFLNKEGILFTPRQMVKFLRRLEELILYW